MQVMLEAFEVGVARCDLTAGKSLLQKQLQGGRYSYEVDVWMQDVNQHVLADTADD